MDAATVSRVMSLIPERSAWSPSGSAFGAEGKSDRVTLIARLLHWLSPLEALTPENQQALGIRAGGGRAADDDVEALEPEEVDDTAVRQPEPGTQIAA